MFLCGWKCIDTVFCSSEPGFSIVAASAQELKLLMIDKSGNMLHSVSRQKVAGKRLQAAGHRLAETVLRNEDLEKLPSAGKILPPAGKKLPSEGRKTIRRFAPREN